MQPSCGTKLELLHYNTTFKNKFVKNYIIKKLNNAINYELFTLVQLTTATLL